VRPLTELRRGDRLGQTLDVPGVGLQQVDVHVDDMARELWFQAGDVDALHLAQLTVTGIGQLSRVTLLRRPHATFDLDVSAGRRGHVQSEWHEATVDEEHPAVVESHRRDDVQSRPPVLRPVHDQDLFVGQVGAGGGDRSPLDVGRISFGEHVVEWLGGDVEAGFDLGVEVPPLVEPAQLPEAQVHHRDDGGDDEQVESDPARSQQEPVHAASTVAAVRQLASAPHCCPPATFPAVEPGEITPSWLSDVLDGHVGGIATERIGDGLVGMNLRITLLDADPTLPASVVAKLPSPDPTSRVTGIALRNYEREVRFYLDVAPTVDIRVPHCFHGEWDAASGDFVLLLEDMHPAEQGDQIAGCSVERAAITVAELAKLHGPRWDDPTLFDLEWLTRRHGSDDTAMVVALWQNVYAGFEATYAKYLSADALALVRHFGGALADWLDGHAAPLAVTHGDFRLDNLLFGTAEGGPPVTAVDWQTPAHSPPIGDLSYFLGAGLRPDDRLAHERSLVARYGEALTAYGVDVDESWLWEQYRRDAFGGVVMAVIASQIVGSNERSEAMFTAMATRHLQHALDLDSLAVV
jgi:Ecdysteroid kinase-like family